VEPKYPKSTPNTLYLLFLRENFGLMYKIIFCCRACIATMGILYYRLSQRSLSENFAEDEIQ
jgi:hypothetical protein